MELLQGRKGLIVGVANSRSIAYGISAAVAAQGAELILTYQNERLRPKVAEIAEELGAVDLFPCDVGSDASIEALIESVTERWGELDFIVHAVAFANREDLAGRFVDTSREGFGTALDISVYSLVALSRGFEPLLKAGAGGGSVLTLSYYGGEKVIPNYNVMGVAKAALESTVRYLAVDLGPDGIRVNGISSGPIKTLSAAGIRGMRSQLSVVGAQTPLRRNITLEDIGGAAVFALSDLGSGMTGEIFHVDAGYHALGAYPEAAEGA